MVSQGLQCLKSSVSSTTNLYTQALLAYTFSLAGDTDVRNILLGKLDQQAIVSGMLVLLAFAFFFFFATLHGMQNFPDQGSNPLGCQGSPFYFLSWHMACRILVPWPGIEPRSTTVKALGPNHWTPREVPVFLKLWKDVKNFPSLHSPTYVQF